MVVVCYCFTLFGFCCSFFVVFFSLFGFRGLVLVVRCSLFLVRRSLCAVVVWCAVPKKRVTGYKHQTSSRYSFFPVGYC